LTALLELRDISDELRTLDKLFIDQTKVIDQMLMVFTQLERTAPPSKEHSPSTASPQAVAWLEEATAYIQGYLEQSKDMQHRCESVQEAYKLLLDMKQKQANVAEASLSRLSAEVASEQNRAVLVFTIFTVLFLPLSFFTSLFGMNVSEWTGTSTNPDFHEVFLITGCVSAGIIVIALTLAFNKPIRHKVMSSFRRSLKHWPSKVVRLTYHKLFGSCIKVDSKATSGPRARLPVDVERGFVGSPNPAGESKKGRVEVEKVIVD
jgi:hypothetical protein